MNPWAIDNSEMENLEKQRMQHLAAQNNLLNLQQSGIANAASVPLQQDLSALIGLTDEWSGSNMLRAYKNPESGQQRLSKIAALEQGLANTQNQISAADFQYLKTKLDKNNDDKKLKLEKQMHDEKLQSAERVAGAKATDKSAPKTLTTTALADLAEIKKQYSTLDSLFSDWEKNASGKYSKLEALIPNTKANQYKDYQKLKAQEVGRALEGGKLSDVDYTKYVNFMPDPLDSKDTAQRKIVHLKEMLATAYNQKVDTYSSGGYSSQGLGKLNTDVNSGTKSKGNFYDALVDSMSEKSELKK